MYELCRAWQYYHMNLHPVNIFFDDFFKRWYIYDKILNNMWLYNYIDDISLTVVNYWRNSLTISESNVQKVELFYVIRYNLNKKQNFFSYVSCLVFFIPMNNLTLKSFQIISSFGNISINPYLHPPPRCVNGYEFFSIECLSILMKYQGR